MAPDGLAYTDSMSLKVTELLKEVQLDYSPSFTKAVDGAVSSVKQALRKIPKGLKVTADLAPGFVRDIKADKVSFKFKRPKFFEVAGSYSMQCVARPDINVDLFIRIPKACFYEKDYLNYRYHAKRFLYLCVLKNHLMSSSTFRDIRWSTLQNEARKPILLVYPATESSESAGFVLRLIPTVDKDLFCESKLKLERNNIHFLDQGNALQATPIYNCSILEDMLLEENAEFVKRTFLGWKELKDALILLKVWARQRHSVYSHDCLNGFLISVIMTYLATESGRNRINNSMNPMQIFRVTLDFIANSKLWSNGVFFHPIASKKDKTGLKSFPVVLYNSSANFNLGFRMSHNGFQELQQEATLTLACMVKCGDSAFEEIFMTKMDFPVKYDFCVRLNLKGNTEVSSLGFCLDDECWRYYERKILSIMAEGLKDRAKCIRVIWRNTVPVNNFEEGFLMLDREELFIGISVSSVEDSFKKVTMGPSPEEKEKALKFRNFWGEKATLRQFRDSRIAEVVVWERNEWEKHLIMKDLTEYILSRHLSLPSECIFPIVDQLDFCLLYGSRDPITYSKSMLLAFDALSKRLRLLDDIPLKVSSVQPLNSAFRFASVFPPIPHPLAFEKQVKLQKLTSTCLQPLEVMIQLEGSGNWPMNEVALEKTKSAFLLKIGESLQTNWGMTCSATEDDVDVFISGFTFRLKILHERGLNLVRKPSGSGQVKRVLSTDIKLFASGQHSSMINGLCGRYPTYGPVVRLAKRWVSSHLLSSLLVEEAVELLVAYIFLKPFPFTAPVSRITGFLRFLRLLSEYDWLFSALVIDINNDLTSSDEKEINDNFKLSRKNGGENPLGTVPAMFLATAYDKASEAWTGSSPSGPELRRLVAYATSSANLLSQLIMHNQSDSYRWECLFRTPLSTYDAVILLHRDKLPYPHRLLFPSEVDQGRLVAYGQSSKLFHPFILPGEGEGMEIKDKVMVNFDPVKCFINDVEKDFPSMFKVWYDSLGGDALGLTWSKSNLKKRSRDMMDDDDMDFIETLKAVGEVGKGLVRSVHLLKAPKLKH